MRFAERRHDVALLELNYRIDARWSIRGEISADAVHGPIDELFAIEPVAVAKLEGAG